MKRYARMLLCIMLLAALLPGRTGAAKADGPAGAAGRSNEGGGASLSGRSLSDPRIKKKPEAIQAIIRWGDQQLVTDGVAEGGKFYYALGTDAETEPDPSDFVDKIPMHPEGVIPIGVYYVWYKVIWDDTHQATVPEVVTVIIPPLVASKNIEGPALDLKEFAVSLPEGVKYDKTMFFYLPKDIANGDTMLTVRGGQIGQPTDLTGKPFENLTGNPFGNPIVITFGVAALEGVNLKKGDTVNLIYNENGLVTDEGLSTVPSSNLAKASFLAQNNLGVDTRYELSIKKKDDNTIICTVDDIIVNPDPDPNGNSGNGGNNGEVAPATVSAPVFDPEDGIFTGDSLQVSITSATPGAEIHYTMAEGTEEPVNPTSASDKYIGPITIRETTTIKAVAVAQGFSNSAIVTKIYTKQTAQSGIPVLRYLLYDTDTLSFVTDTAENCTVLEGKTELVGGWYAVSGPVTFRERPKVHGHVNLILVDDGNLKAEQGISVGEGSSLTIYAQSEGANMGSLEASGTGGGAAIGGGGTITIHGGRIEATTNKFDTAIGGGAVTIYGGRVNAVSYGSGAAIGGDTVAIYGGRVNAVSYGGGAGIGGTVSLGWTGAGDFIYADTYSGTVTLTKPFQDMETGREVADSDDIAGKVLVKDRVESPYAWTGADFILPDDLTAVGDGAFSGIAAGAVLVPANVTGVGAGAFAGSADSGTLKIRFLGENTGFVGSPFAGRGAVVAFAPKDSDTLKNLRGLSGVVAFPLD